MVAGLSLALLAVAAIGGAFALFDARPSPEELQQLVHDYASAVSAGDTAAANELVPLHPLVANVDVAAQARPRTPPTVNCEEPVIDDAIAAVRCVVSADGVDEVPVSLRAEVHDREWRLLDTLAVEVPRTISLTHLTAVSTLQLGTSDQSLWLYPGNYEVRLSSTPAVTAPTRTSMLVTPRGAFMVAQGEISAAVEEAAESEALRVVGCEPAAASRCQGPDGSASFQARALAYRPSSALVGTVEVRVTGTSGAEQTVPISVRFSADLDAFVVGRRP